MTGRQKPKQPEVTGHLSPAHYAEALEQYVEELDAYYGNLLQRAGEAIAAYSLHLALCPEAYDVDAANERLCRLMAEIREHLGKE